ncbi:phospholipid-binding protein MlaC [Elusimicrobiota bacterium]
MKSSISMTFTLALIWPLLPAWAASESPKGVNPPATKERKARIASDAKDVRGVVERSVNTVLDILKDTKIEEAAKRKKVMDVVDPVFDLRLMAKLVLGRKNWAKFDKTQRGEFTDLFVDQLQTSYFDKVEILTDESVEFEDPVAVKKGKKIHFQMLTHIVSKGERYGMLYKLASRKGKWRVYDVEIEGISLVRSYGAQYDQFLRKESSADLLSKMRKKSLDLPEDLKEKKETEKEKAAPKKAPEETAERARPDR